ncbi:hypothetical protein K1719_016958 [Acacia pycnantha]|nr:hypothetical protein K1719_016958 [Acacia pycnantha]
MDLKFHKNKQTKSPRPNPPVGLPEDYDDVQKKLIRRHTERQRRKEMADLSASLRSLLPLEYIKGKRLASDHLNEAAQYIKHLQNRIEELSCKRNRLRMICNLNVDGLILLENHQIGTEFATEILPSPHHKKLLSSSTNLQRSSSPSPLRPSSSTSVLLLLFRLLIITFVHFW